MIEQTRQSGPAARRQHVKARLRGLFSTRSRKITAVVVVVALVAAVVWIAWPTPGPTPIATRDLTITAPGGPGVDEPVQLDSTLYLPAQTPAPAVIMAHGFGGSKNSVASDAEQMARAGFVVLAYSARGFGASTGQIALDSLDYEIPDAQGHRRLARRAAGGRSGCARRPAGGRHRRLVRWRAVADAGRHRQADRRRGAADHLERPGTGAVPERAGDGRRSGGADTGRGDRRRGRCVEEALGVQPDRLDHPRHHAVPDRGRAGRQRRQRLRPPRRHQHQRPDPGRRDRQPPPTSRQRPRRATPRRRRRCPRVADG